MRLFIELRFIDDNPFQKRTDYADVGELANRIRSAFQSHKETLGLLQVPVARLVADDGEVVPVGNLAPSDVQNMLLSGVARVQLAFGHRRKRAFDHLQRGRDRDYAAGVMPLDLADLDDERMLDAVWSENYERKDITAVEQAELLAAKLARPGPDGSKRSQRDVAEEWGLGRSTVTNRLRLLEAPPGIKDANRDGRLSERQCLALLPVVQVAQALNGQAEAVRWGDEPDPRRRSSWGWTPPAPVDFLEWVVNGGDDLTSDEIRAYTKAAIAHVGEPLPDGIATTEVDYEDSGICLKPEAPRALVQPGCRGCEYRVHETCLHPPCLEEKKWLYGRRLAIEAAAELELDFSAEPKDFKPFDNWDKAGNLKELWKAGGCEHLVVGWCDSGYGVRPFADHPFVSGRNAYDHGNRSAIVIGHEGKLTDACRQIVVEAKLAAGEAVDEEPPDPLEEHRVEWGDIAQKQVDSAKKKVRAALVDMAMDVDDVGLLDSLVHILAGRKHRDGQAPYELAGELVKWAWDRGLIWGWQQRDYPEKGMAVLQNVAERAGIGHVLDEEMTLEARGIRVLAAWSRARQFSYQRKDTAAEIEEPLAELVATIEDHIDALDLPAQQLARLTDLLNYLELAEAEVAEILEPEEEGAETVPA